MYQTPFKITAKSINHIACIAALQTRFRESAAVNPEPVLPGPYRQGRGYAGSAAGLPPGAGRIPFLVSDLRQWLERSEEHLLIKGCVLLYEFEYLRPYESHETEYGIGLMKQLLAGWNGVFGRLPLESLVAEKRDGYDRALEVSSERGNSGLFIEFMLGLVSEALSGLMPETETETKADLINDLLKEAEANPGFTYREFGESIGVSEATVKRYLQQLKRQGRIVRVGARKNGFWRIVK